MQGIFVTGTDTEVGKTFVSVQLVKMLIDEGMKVSVMKPVASGAKYHAGILKNDDALALMEVANVVSDYAVVNPFVFEPAIAPHLAAAQAGINIDFDTITANFKMQAEKSDVVLIEGAGGWYAPLGMNSTIADLANVLASPVIIVVGLRLGCINHAILTVKAIQQTGLTIAGWIANHISKDFISAEENISILKNLLNDVPFIGAVPFQTNPHQTSSSTQQFDHSLNKQFLIKNVR